MKLVRDKIPRLIEESGKRPVYRTVHGKDELLALLGSKMKEEVEEFIADPCIEEAADVFEVFRQLCIQSDILVEDVIYKASDKRYKNGGFSDGIVLIRTDNG